MYVCMYVRMYVPIQMSSMRGSKIELMQKWDHQGKLLSELLMEKRTKLAGQILHTPPQDALGQVSCQPDSANMFHIGKRRVGGPRQNWYFCTKKVIWEACTARPFAPYTDTNRQNQYIRENAVNRQF